MSKATPATVGQEVGELQKGVLAAELRDAARAIPRLQVRCGRSHSSGCGRNDCKEQQEPHCIAAMDASGCVAAAVRGSGNFDVKDTISSRQQQAAM